MSKDWMFVVHGFVFGIYDLPPWHHMRWGIGGIGSIHLLPDRLDSVYGETPLSAMLFARLKLN